LLNKIKISNLQQFKQQWPDLFEIVACANRTEDKALQYAELVGLAKDHVYTDYNKLLDRSVRCLNLVFIIANPDLF